MKIPKHLIDITSVSHVNLKGRGGEENAISQLLPDWNRVNEVLYDFEIDDDGDKYQLEIKKQRNEQWFDSGKYHNLNSSDREIRIMFIIHKDGRIEIIAIAILGEFLDWLLKNRSSDGWTGEVLELGATLKERFPSLQFKASAKIKTILKEAPDLFDVIYNRENAEQ